MRDDQNETSAAATGAGAVLAGVLSLFARSADDVARLPSPIGALASSSVPLCDSTSGEHV